MKNKAIAPIQWALAAIGFVAITALAGQPRPPNVAMSSPLAPAQASADVPMAFGSGAGVHGALSPFAPLSTRADVLPWSLLSMVEQRATKHGIRPVFTPEQQALSQKQQRIHGFMLPLDPGEKQTHFLLSAVPLTCSFCMPGGPESMIEVKTRVAVRYTVEPVVVEGRFAVLPDDPQGLYYRMTDAVPAK